MLKEELVKDLRNVGTTVMNTIAEIEIKYGPKLAAVACRALEVTAGKIAKDLEEEASKLTTTSCQIDETKQHGVTHTQGATNASPRSEVPPSPPPSPE